MAKQKTLWKSKNKELTVELIKGLMFGFVKVPESKWCNTYALVLGPVLFQLEVRKRKTHIEFENQIKY